MSSVSFKLMLKWGCAAGAADSSMFPSGSQQCQSSHNGLLLQFEAQRPESNDFLDKDTLGSNNFPPNFLDQCLVYFHGSKQV